MELELMELVKKVQDRRADGTTIEILSAARECPEPFYAVLSSFSNQDSGGVILLAWMPKTGLRLRAFMMPVICKKRYWSSAGRWSL